MICSKKAASSVGRSESKVKPFEGESGSRTSRGRTNRKNRTELEGAQAELLEVEIYKQIETDALRQTSHQQLLDTRKRYNEMLAALKRSEQSMDPVLHKLHDYVLALKHTLNAQAIAALGGESAKIQSDVARLIEDMNSSIEQADEFIRQMPK